MLDKKGLGALGAGLGSVAKRPCRFRRLGDIRKSKQKTEGPLNLRQRRLNNFEVTINSSPKLSHKLSSSESPKRVAWAVAILSIETAWHHHQRNGALG